MASSVFCSICNETFPDINSLITHEELHKKVTSTRKIRFSSYCSSSVSVSTLMTMLCNSRHQHPSDDDLGSTSTETNRNDTANNIDDSDGDTDDVNFDELNPFSNKNRWKNDRNRISNNGNFNSNNQAHLSTASTESNSDKELSSYGSTTGMPLRRKYECDNVAADKRSRYLHLSNQIGGGIRITVGMNNDAMDSTSTQQQPVQQSSNLSKGICEYCHQPGIVYVKSMECHLRRYHPDKTTPYHCYVCTTRKRNENIRFSKKEDFLAHMATHDAPGKSKRKGLDAHLSSMKMKKANNTTNEKNTKKKKQRDDDYHGGDLDEMTLSNSINLDIQQKHLGIPEDGGVPVKMELPDAAQDEASGSVPTVTLKMELADELQDEAVGSVTAWTTVVKKEEQAMSKEPVIDRTCNDFMEPKLETI